MDSTATLAAQSYQRARPATAAEPGAPASPGPEGRSAFVDAVDGLARTLARADATAQAAMTGQADPHALVEALAASETAVATVVTIRDRVVEAYQELLRIPV
jgi:flagellar hook-basal body complex protein FliE